MAEPDRFVGRADELDRCAGLLARAGSVRVVTLTGFGGSGKTRLAQRVVRDNAHRFRGGCYEIRLSRTPSGAEGEEIAEAIAASLGLDNQAGTISWVQMAQNYLKRREVLLFLDNCEHVLDAVRTAIDSFITTCAGVTVLATSRVPIRAVGEHLFPVTELEPGDAMELFEARAAAVGAAPVTESDIACVREIVALVDCMPLAVEITARRLRYMPAEILLARLQERRLKVGGDPLDGILQWHDELCTPAERLLWQWLSVFRGGFTAAAAEGAWAGDESGDQDVLDLLAGLIDKSIVTFDRATGRYWMLERVREYGEQRLRASGRETTARRRHLEHYRCHQEQRARQWFSVHEVEYMQEARSDLPNLRAALTFAVEDDLVEPGLALWSALSRLRAWTWTGLLSESARWLDQLLALPSGSAIAPEQRAVALTRAAKNVFFAGDQQGAERLMRRAEREAGAAAGVVRIAIDHAIAVKHMFVDMASESIQELDALFDQAEALGLDEEERFMLLLYRALATGMYGSYEQAQREGQALKRAATDAGAEWMITWAQWPLANAEIRFGKLASARARLRSALRSQAEWGERWGPLWFVEGIGWSHPNPIEGARVLGAARTLQELCGSEISGLGGWYLQHNEARKRIIAAIGREEFDRAYAAGASVSSYTEIMELALRDPVLTRREREVAVLVTQGLSNKEIAAVFTLSPRTVEAHVAGIMAKFGISQRERIADFLSPEHGEGGEQPRD